MNLENLWFCLIAVLWAGYFALEGFDFGVGMLLPFVPRDERERGAMFESIGPVWDGNEVWLVVAGGATFAAFPAWYATMFSGFYLALLLVLFFLIIRVVSFEWRAKGDSPRWRTTWQWANTIGSFGASLVWGVGLSALLYGLPIDTAGDFTGSLVDLFNPYTVLGGVSVVLLFAYHGATYLTIRTTGDLCERAGRAARRLAILAVPVAAGFLAWTVVVAVDRNQRGASGPLVPALLGIGALVIALFVTAARRSGSAFAFTGAAVVLWVATVFTSLYPRVMVSSTGFANSLSVQSTASAHYTLAVMTVVAAIFVPLVLLYQGWTYHVFRARVGGGDLTGAAPTEPPPAVPGGSPAT
jgi:cytochrome d ubiquinol oxidase subunit II